MAPGACPYLEPMAGQQSGPPPGTEHHCVAQQPPTGPAALYQSQVCLSSKYRGCQYFPDKALLAEKAPDIVDLDRQALQGSLVQQAKDPKTQIKPIGSRPPISTSEILVWGLAISVLFAAVFAVFAVLFSKNLGPETGVYSNLAAAPGNVLDQATATLVPTFTPTPQATQSSLAQIPEATSTPGPGPEPTLLLPTVEARPAASSPPTRLVIPGIQVDIAVEPVGTKVVKNGNKTSLIWADVANAGGFHQTSALPGNPGNTVINGHRDTQGSVFRKLDKVQAGDEITVYVGEIAYPYVVSETIVLPETFASAAKKAENLKYIAYLPEERLTLVTCTPVGLATHRLLVIAAPPEELLPQMPEAGSEDSP